MADLFSALDDEDDGGDEVRRERNARLRAMFERFHRENPRIYELFKQFANEARDAGRQRYGAKGIIEQIRWETTVKSRGEFKCNDACTAYYVRMLIREDPTFRGFFDLRAADADNNLPPPEPTE
jgi:hypothetical protein